MQRAEIVEISNGEVIEKASHLFGIDKDDLKVFPQYEGCANLVYEYELDGISRILRISFRPDRSAAQIRAELDFVNYLAENGVRVSRPIYSKNGNLLETIQAGGFSVHAVSFIKGKGMRVPDNDYRYREDAPIEEYFQNWGRSLGQMHALTKSYTPTGGVVKRPDWFELHKPESLIEERVPDLHGRRKDQGGHI